MLRFYFILLVSKLSESQILSQYGERKRVDLVQKCAVSFVLNSLIRNKLLGKHTLKQSQLYRENLHLEDTEYKHMILIAFQR